MLTSKIGHCVTTKFCRIESWSANSQKREYQDRGKREPPVCSLSKSPFPTERVKRRTMYNYTMSN